MLPGVACLAAQGAAEELAARRFGDLIDELDDPRDFVSGEAVAAEGGDVFGSDGLGVIGAEGDNGFNGFAAVGVGDVS